MGKEKKEIWMEKLIELLNEFEKTLEPNLQVRWTVLWIEATPELIVGKKFWFIKWLVENDKIDFEWKLNTLRFESLVDQTLDSYLALLMILSISNSPIEDLLLYLK